MIFRVSRDSRVFRVSRVFRASRVFRVSRVFDGSRASSVGFRAHLGGGMRTCGRDGPPR